MNFFRLSRWSTLHSVMMEMMIIVLIQPLLVLFISVVIPNNIPLITLLLGIALLVSINLAKHDFRSHLLYYWIVLSITYTIIVFEWVVIPLSEIEAQENFFLVLFTVISMFFLYLTIISNNKCLVNDDSVEHKNGDYVMNGTSICPVCKVKMWPRNYHCHICQECISQYDHHSYWLNCCIGERNLHYYVTGIFFGVFPLAYASLLILSTVCSPEYKFGILLPENCTDVGDDIEMCTCVVCGIYCLELSVILLYKFIRHVWLVSRGMSTFEWAEHYRYGLSHIGPYNYGFRKNWIEFFKKFKHIRF